MKAATAMKDKRQHGMIRFTM